MLEISLSNPLSALSFIVGRAKRGSTRTSFFVCSMFYGDAPNRPPNTLTIGPSNAPRNPPLCTILFFSLSDVFFSANFLNERLCRFSFLLCSGVSFTLPTRTFITHSQIHLTNSRLQCCFNSAARALDENLCNLHRYGT